MIRAAHFAELDAATLYGLLRLRTDVFVVEQKCAYPELDGRDTEAGTVHLWLEDGGVPVAYLRILAEPDGSARIGRVCTASTHRGTGLSVALLTDALDRLSGVACALDAQSYLVGFYYTRFGFTPTGPEYLDDGIPHVPMVRAAAPS